MPQIARYSGNIAGICLFVTGAMMAASPRMAGRQSWYLTRRPSRIDHETEPCSFQDGHLALACDLLDMRIGRIIAPGQFFHANHN